MVVHGKGTMTILDLESLRSRTPARRRAEIPKDVFEALSSGQLETKNLVEWLAVDRKKLFDGIREEMSIELSEANLQELRRELQGATALKASMAIGRMLSESVQVADSTWRLMSAHASDIVREWSALIVGFSSLTFPKKLAWVKPMAGDANAGLREIAWLALRADVLRDPVGSIQSLVPWTGSRQDRLRRYASEITRPRGVWTSHVAMLKKQPQLGLPILEPLKADDSQYVKDSVANWMNDASKSNPEWVREVTDRWREESDSEHTQYIVRRALRTLDKKS